MSDEKGRTEEDKITQAGITVILGGKKYKVKPLVIRDSREWRKKVAPFIASTGRYASISSDNPDEFEKAFIDLCTTMLDTVADLFFEYARDLNREKIEKKATDKELFVAWAEVRKLAFPFEVNPPKEASPSP